MEKITMSYVYQLFKAALRESVLTFRIHHNKREDISIQEQKTLLLCVFQESRKTPEVMVV